MGPLGIYIPVFLLQICTLQGVLKPVLIILQSFPIGCHVYSLTGGGGRVCLSLPRNMNSAGEAGSAWLYIISGVQLLPL